MRNIKYIVLHCTATPQNTTIESIKKHWKRIGWKNVGYHWIVKPNGSAERLATIDKITNGVKGYNSNSIHISYIGGKDIDDRTEEQKDTIKDLVEALKIEFPDAIIQGHRDFPDVKKSCPRFDAKVEFEYLNK